METTIQLKYEGDVYYSSDSNIREIKIKQSTNKSFYISSGQKKHALSKNEIDNLFEMLSKLQVGIFPEYAEGCDGVFYTLRIEQGFNSVEYHWWVDLAGEEWKGLYEIRDFMKKLSKKYFKNIS